MLASQFWLKNPDSHVKVHLVTGPALDVFPSFPSHSQASRHSRTASVPASDLDGALQGRSGVGGGRRASSRLFGGVGASLASSLAAAAAAQEDRIRLVLHVRPEAAPQPTGPPPQSTAWKRMFQARHLTLPRGRLRFRHRQA